MLRVISGSAKGRRLECPPGKTTRPPTDMLKLAVFNILGPRVEGARVLDLFAGCGAFGIEALSRGAASCLFVDQDRRAVGVLNANLAHVGLAGRAEVRCRDAGRLTALAGEERFDLVFLDPPFALAWEEKSLALLCATVREAMTILAPGGTLLLRLPRRRKLKPDLPEPSDARTYGDSEMWFYRAG